VALAKYILPDITYIEKSSKQQSSPQPLAKETSGSRDRILKYGVPSPGIPTLLEYENHVLEYDPARKVPKWVAEHVSQNKAFGEVANRKLAKFDADPVIPAHFASDNKDFWGSGWSRGHMAPAGNNKHSQTAMNQTFYLTNIIPQDIDNNGNYWNRLEIFCRNLTKQYQDVYIISGPLWLTNDYSPRQHSLPILKPNELPALGTQDIKFIEVSNKREGNTSSGDKVDTSRKDRQPRPPKKFVKYEVIGKNNVAVPTHLFKIILVEDPSLQKPMMSSFIIPNSPVQDVKLEDFEVELTEIEKQVGVRFHQDLDHEHGVERLCLASGCKLNNYKEFQEFFWARRIKTPWNIKFLERDWQELCKRGLKTPELEEIYLTKKKEFEEKERLIQEEKSATGPNQRIQVPKTDQLNVQTTDQLKAATPAAA